MLPPFPLLLIEPSRHWLVNEVIFALFPHASGCVGPTGSWL
jgi:hypothetical protein